MDSYIIFNLNYRDIAEATLLCYQTRPILVLVIWIHGVSASAVRTQKPCSDGPPQPAGYVGQAPMESEINEMLKCLFVKVWECPAAARGLHLRVWQGKWSCHSPLCTRKGTIEPISDRARRQ